MRKRAHKAVVRLYHIASLPVSLSQVIPCLYKSRVMLDGLGEAVLSLLTVVGEDVESTSPQTPPLNFGQRVWKHTITLITMHSQYRGEVIHYL